MHSPKLSLLFLLFCCVTVVAGCPSTPGGPPCGRDADCETGRYCATGGVGCTFDCRLDIDCTGGATCSARGRCEADVPDGGIPRDGAPALCRNDGDCDDGTYCNGLERCTPGTSADGCVAGSTPCPSGATCDEAAGMCRTTCDEDGDGNGRLDADNDGDGHRSIACGASGSIPGDDCDDNDANRFPRTGAEVCDDTDPGHDEDCDPCTVSDYLADDGDDDGDGFVSETCSNPLRDTDDVSTFTCPGTINEFTRIRSADRVVTGNDCNDTPGAGNGIDPGVAEICNGFDDNCDDLIDGAMPGLVCECIIGAPARPCGDTDVGACSYGTQNCIDGMWGTCVGAVGPVMEYCGGGDANCNGMVDEGFLVDCMVDEDNDYYMTPGSAVMPRCRDNSRPAWGFCPVGYIAPGSNRGDDCAPTDILAWVYYNVRTDADGDGYCVGPAASPRCGGTVEPSGYSVACLSFNDCNDGNGAQSVSVTIRTDFDGDTYCDGDARTACTDGSVPAGTRLALACFGNDAADTNICVTTSGSATRVESCMRGPYGCPSSGMYCEVSCPSGFRQSTAPGSSDCRVSRVTGTQAGFCVATDYGDRCGLSLTCNGYDSSICGVRLTCEPIPFYLGGPCG